MRPDKRGTKIDLRPPQAEAVTVDRQHVAGHQTRAGLQTLAEPRSMAVPQAAITFPRPFKASHPSTKGTVASIPRHFASVWSKYELFTSTHHRKDLAGATRSRGIRERVFVIHVAKSEAKGRLSIVNRVSCPYVAAVSETYESPTALDFVCDFFELTLVHFQNHTVVLEEKAIAAVAGQVKMLPRIEIAVADHFSGRLCLAILVRPEPCCLLLRAGHDLCCLPDRRGENL